MQQRIELKISGEVVMQIMCKPGISDGDLATMLEDTAQDLHWNVMKDVETVFFSGRNIEKKFTRE